MPKLSCWNQFWGASNKSEPPYLSIMLEVKQGNMTEDIHLVICSLRYPQYIHKGQEYIFQRISIATAVSNKLHVSIHSVCVVQFITRNGFQILFKYANLSDLLWKFIWKTWRREKSQKLNFLQQEIHFCTFCHESVNFSFHVNRLILIK